MVGHERLYLLSSGTWVDFFPEQGEPRLASSELLLQTSTGPDLHVRWAHTSPDRGSSTKHFTGGTSNSNLCPLALSGVADAVHVHTHPYWYQAMAY